MPPNGVQRIRDVFARIRQPPGKEGVMRECA